MVLLSLQLLLALNLVVLFLSLLTVLPVYILALAKHYIRRVRSDKKDPLAVYMEQAGFPVEQDVMSPSSVVFSFPVKSPESSTCVKEVGAMEQLALWKTYQNHWCEHKPSVTVYYTDSEYFKVAQWIWDNFDLCSGISLLPTSDHVYQQAPYEDH